MSRFSDRLFNVNDRVRVVSSSRPEYSGMEGIIIFIWKLKKGYYYRVVTEEGIVLFKEDELQLR